MFHATLVNYKTGQIVKDFGKSADSDILELKMLDYAAANGHGLAEDGTVPGTALLYTIEETRPTNGEAPVLCRREAPYAEREQMPQVTLTNLLPLLSYELVKAIDSQLKEERNKLRQKAAVDPGLQYPETAILETLEQTTAQTHDYLANF